MQPHAGRVLFVGDINVDVMMGGLASLPQVDREITCQSFEVTMGSAAVVAACAYASLGGRAAFLGLAGCDDYGEFMLRGMRDFGIDVRRVQRTRRVRTGVTVNLIHGRTRSQVTYPGTIAAFDGSGVTASVLDGMTHAHFAGPYQQTRFRPAITRLLRAARKRGVTTSLDPQWDATERWQRMDEWLPRLSYLFVNADEALSITRARTVEEAARRLAGRTPCPVIKDGRAGALVVVDGRVERVPTYRARIVDTTGAGDSFDAGFLYARIAERAGVREAAAFGNAVGARSCLFAGGVAARSTRRDIRDFMRRPYERV
jgi:sugar/nucleoside kinase (ribokinase family)